MSEVNFEDLSKDTKFNKERSYWLNKLSGDAQLSSFPTDKFRAKEHHYNVAINKSNLSEKTCSKLFSMSNKSEYALYMILLSGVNYLLNKYTQKQDVVVIMPVFKQNKDMDTLMNKILPLRLEIDDKNNFKEFLQKIKNVVMEANSNQNFSIMNLLSSLNTELSDNKLPILNTVVLLDSIHDKKYLGDMRSDMLFSFLRSSDNIEVCIEYNSLLYSENTIKYLTEYLSNYFDAIVNNPDINLNEINIISDEGKKTILKNSVSSETKYFNQGENIEITFSEILKNLTGRKPNINNSSEVKINKVILGKNGEIQPLGVIGELCVEMNGLIKLGISGENFKLEETNEQTSVSNEKLYKTGCLARWIDDNRIEYIGRINQFISIRGCDVNLNEIERILLQREDIIEVKVIQKQSSKDRKYICAYVKSWDEINTSELKDYISQIVPEYKIPNYFIIVKDMPLRSDGSLNEDELPSPNKSLNEEIETKEIQTKLLKIWKSILEVEDIKLDDDFFDLGGYSVLAVKLEVELEKIGMVLPSYEIHKYKTIKEQATQIWNNM